MVSNGHDLQMRQLMDAVNELRETNARLQEAVDAGREREKESQTKIQELEKQLKMALEQAKFFQSKLFGTSSEKRPHVVDGQVAFDIDYIFNEAEAIDDEENASSDSDVETITFKRRKKPRMTKAEQLKGVKVVEKIIDLPENEQYCPECGTKMTPMGKKFLHYIWDFTPAKLAAIALYGRTYQCPRCKLEGDKDVIVNAKADPLLIPGSMATAPIVAHVMAEKYSNALPLYRQEKYWEQFGAILSRGTLASWINVCSDKYFMPLVEYFHRCILKREFLMADETRVQVLKEPERNPQTDSFMWLYRTGEDGLPPIIIYNYTETRKKQNAEAFLKGFKGYLMTDGYQGYDNLPDIIHTSCWAHVRRGFYDAIPAGHKNDLSEPAVQGVVYCDKLFEIEKYCREHGFDYKQRYEYRLKHVPPILEAFWKWLNGLEGYDPKSRFGRAVNYALNRKTLLENYLQDGRCSLSNNLSENAIRPFCVGRKNWLFSDTPKGAKASAAVYTLIEMAKANNLNPEKYLTFLLEKRPDKSWTEEQFENISPWSQEAVDYCGKDVSGKEEQLEAAE